MMLLTIPVGLADVWGFCNLAGWAFTRIVGGHKGPLNWRILAGPVVYLNWLDRQ